MQSGKLRHRLTIQDKGTPARNSYGEEVITWVDVATVWGSVEPLVGREYLESKQLQADVSMRVRIRYRDGIKPEMRLLVFGQRTLEIVSAIHIQERKRELVLMCREMIE